MEPRYSDHVIVKGLQLHTKLGCCANERAHTQLIELDFEVSIDSRVAAKSRDLRDTVCYLSLSNLIEEFSRNREWILIEQFSGDVCQLVFEHFSAAHAVTLEVRKFVLPNAKSVGLRIRRERER